MLSKSAFNGPLVVTGAAGFIGSAVIWRLNELGFHRIIACDFEDKLASSPNLAVLTVDEFISPNQLIRSPLFDEASAVIHLGACSSTTETDLDYLILNNFKFTRSLAMRALRSRTPFLYASSAATYGDGSNGMSDDTSNLSSLKPLSAYASSKHMFDCFAAEEGFLDQIAGLKYFNVFGPNEDHKGEMKSFVAKAHHQITTAGTVQVFKSYDPRFAHGEQERDFIYIKDAVDATLHLLEQGAKGGLYNVGTATTTTWNTLAHAVFAALGRSPDIEYVEMPSLVRENYQYSTRADIRKLRATGFATPWTSIDDAISDYVSKYLEPGRNLGELQAHP